MTEQTSPYRTLKNGSIDLAYYDKRARALRSEDTFRACRRCKAALWTASGHMKAAFTRAFKGPVKVVKRIGKPAAFHALAYVASSTASSQSATEPSISS